MRVALAHDWLTGMRGGEKLLSLLCGLLPEAHLFTLLHVKGSCDRRIERMRIITSFLDDLPGVQRYYRYLLPLMPLAVEGLDASGCDLVISSSTCVAKGLIVSPESVHVCYCNTPMRYVWDQAEAYRRTQGLPGAMLHLMRGYLRAWDRRSVSHVDRFIANSRNIAERIRRTYGCQSDVVYPCIDPEFYTPADVEREDFYLVVGALAPYKRTDQAVAAFAELGRPLRIIGTGQQLARLRRNLPPNVTLLGWQDDQTIREHYRRCRALIFPGEEDFGLVPVEAMACGAPVVAYGRGGATETVLDVGGDHPDGPTGLLYTPGTPEGLASAVRRFEQVADRFDPPRLAAWARRFGPEQYVEGIKRVVGRLLRARGLVEPWSSGTTR